MYRRVSRVVVLAGFGLTATLVAQKPVAIAPVSLPPELNRVLRDYEKAWQAKDGKALALLFADDGLVLSSGRPLVQGREAIERQYSAMAGGELHLQAFT